MGNSLTTAILILHGLAAVALLGALTHQAFAGGGHQLPDQIPAATSLAVRYRVVDPAVYSRFIVLLFCVTTVLGGSLYPAYRILVRPMLEASDFRVANGCFEIKEHLSALGLLLLPAYWAAWTDRSNLGYAAVRRGLTWILAATAWWNYLVGHVLNNIHGLFL